MKFILVGLSLIHLSCAMMRKDDSNTQCMTPGEYQKKSSDQILEEAKKIVSRPSEKKAIAFCVFGSKKMYTHGVLENIDLAKTLYPSWDVVIFFDSATVPQNIIDKAKEKGAIVKVGPE